MTYQELYREGVQTLTEHGIENAQFDARELLLFVLEQDLNAFLMTRMDEIPDNEAEKCTARYRECISRRSAHEPLQYITNRAEFYGREFYVRPGVLIPRFDTETLIEAVLPEIPENGRILDMCTGSGCILLTLLLESERASFGLGADISAEALSVSEENARRLGYREQNHSFGKTAEFRSSDLFSEVHETFDVIVSNPPYIESSVVDTLAPEVRDFEPHLALDGSEDGLLFYRNITEQSGRHLNQGGILAFEIGYDQGEAVSALMAANGFRNIRCIRDLSGRDRVVTGTFYDR